MMSNEINKLSLVGTDATLAALVFPVVPQIGPLWVHFSCCMGIGSLITFLIVKPSGLTNFLIQSADTLTPIAQGVWWGFRQMVHWLAIILKNLDSTLNP